MSSKAGTWIIVVGALVMVGGLCILPAAFGEHTDNNLIVAGAGVFSMGALMVATGMYLKARALYSVAPEQTDAAPKRVRGGCDLCGTETPVIQCKVHQLHLCGNCLTQHYDFRSCAYVPSTRRTGSKGAVKTMAAKTRGI